jgi:hypothetical protein
MSNLILSDNLHKREGQLALTLFDRKAKSGRLRFIETKHYPNAFTNNGLIQIADQMSNMKLPKMRYMAVGTTSGGKGAASNTLQTEIARVYMANWDNSGTAALVYDAYFIEGVGTGNLVEAGIFNDQLVGNMLSWSDFGAIVKGVLNILRIQWTHNY